MKKGTTLIIIFHCRALFRDPFAESRARAFRTRPLYLLVSTRLIFPRPPQRINKFEITTARNCRNERRPD